MSPLSNAASKCLRAAERISRGELPPVDPADRREHKRHAFRREVISVWAGDGASPHAMASLRSIDISSGGLSLESRSMLYDGQRGVIRLCLPDREPILAGVEALHCRYAGKMRYVIGCRFHRPPHALGRLRFVERNGEVSAVW